MGSCSAFCAGTKRPVWKLSPGVVPVSETAAGGPNGEIVWASSSNVTDGSQLDYEAKASPVANADAFCRSRE